MLAVIKGDCLTRIKCTCAYCQGHIAKHTVNIIVQVDNCSDNEALIHAERQTRNFFAWIKGSPHIYWLETNEVE